MAGEDGDSTSSPSISIRQYIRWLPDGAPEEPTSTLVLTTSRNNYVDARVFMPTELKDPSVIPSSSSSSSSLNFTLANLDWAFAGTSSSTFRTRRASGNSSKGTSTKELPIKPLTPTEEKKDDKDKNSTHTWSSSGSKVIVIRQCTWTHWVDSRGAVSQQTHSDSKVALQTSPMSPVTPENWVDSGTIYPTDKENESLEKGRMANAKGEMQDMEELWRDYVPQKLPGESEAISIALTAENKILGTKGMVIRIGGWCQGIIRSSNGEIGVERWRFSGGGLLDGLVKRYDDSSPIQPDGKWQKIFKIGKMSLPCETAFLKGQELQEGESVTQGGLKWTVIEKELLK